MSEIEAQDIVDGFRRSLGHLIMCTGATLMQFNVELSYSNELMADILEQIAKGMKEMDDL